MIVRPRPDLLQLFFIIRGSIVLKILPQLIMVALLSTGVVWAHRTNPDMVPSFNGAPFSLMGIALSVFLGFRANACYDRWWEARRHWGQLVMSSRSIARQSIMLTDETGNTTQRRLIQLVIAFCHEMVGALRPGSDAEAQKARIPADLREEYGECPNRTDFLLRQISGLIFEAHRSGKISDIQLQMLDLGVQDLGGALASCERIRNTSVPFGYTLLLHRTAHLFCILLPFGFADLLGWATPVSSILIAYTFFGLDGLSDELEEPFSDGINAVPIQAIATTIEINLRDAMGERNLPPMPQPVNYLLM